MKRKLDKKTLTKLNKISKLLPRLVHKEAKDFIVKERRGDSYYGHEAPREANHYKKLKSAYEKFGWHGVTAYSEDVLRIFNTSQQSQELKEAVADAKIEQEIEEADELAAKSQFVDEIQFAEKAIENNK